MKRLWRWMLAGILVVVLLPAGGQPAEAGGPWSAWLYRQDTGQLVRVFPDGIPSESMPFPLPAGYGDYPYELAFSLSGERLAACLTDPGGATSIHVYNMYAGIWTAAYVPSGPVVACHVGQYAFSDDESLLAIGLMNHWPDPADPRPDWEIVVINTATSAVHYHLTSDSPTAVALGMDFSGTRPTITAFSPGVLAFAPILWGSEGAQEYPSVVWQLETGFVSIAGPYGKSGLDYHLPNSEVIWQDERDDFSKGTLEGMGYLYNVVMYSNKAGTLQPIYHRPNAVVERAVFINNGQQIAVRTYVAPGPATWAYLNRSGATGPLSVPNNVYDVRGVYDGLVYLSSTGGPTGGPVFAYHRMSGTAPGTYNLWTGDPGAFWRILWVSPMTGGVGLPAFPAVAPSSPGILITLPPALIVTPMIINTPMLIERPQLIQLPTATPLPMIVVPPAQATLSPALALRVGGTAAINTTEGDTLRVRSGPGTNFGVLFVLQNGTNVQVLDGPMTAGDLTWWYVRVSDGRTGWAVESVPEGNGRLQTLIPTG